MPKIAYMSRRRKLWNERSYTRVYEMSLHCLITEWHCQFLQMEPGRNGVFDDCTKDVLQELQQEEDSDSEEESVNTEA